MLREIEQDIWVADKPLRYLGLSIGTRMTVIRLANQDLVVISPIPVNADMAEQLRGLGSVAHIIAPNLYHYLFAAECKARYPSATFWAAPGLKEKKTDLPIDRIIPVDTHFIQGLEAISFKGLKTLGLNGFDPFNETVFFHRASRTLILTDAAVHFDESFSTLTRFSARVMGVYKKLAPALLERIATTDKQSIKASVENVLSWDFERVIMAHGSIIEQHGKERFKAGYEQFLGHAV